MLGKTAVIEIGIARAAVSRFKFRASALKGPNE